MDEFLTPTSFLDFETPEFNAYVQPFLEITDNSERAIALYNQVRDSFLYDPFHLDLRPAALKASSIILKKRAWCVEKAIVLAASFRATGIPARLGYGNVINHIGVEKLTAILQRKEIVFHGYVEAFVNNHWVKCTPAFDPYVCRISGVPLLDWDGKTDALFQAYKGEEQFMEYVHFYGEFADVPIELMNAEMKKYYPHLFEKAHNSRRFSFFHL